MGHEVGGQIEEIRMRALNLLSLVVTCLCGATFFLDASEPDNPIAVRVASYNVEFGKGTTPEQIGQMFKPYKLDMIGQLASARYSEWNTIMSAKHLRQITRTNTKRYSAGHR